MVQMTHVDSIGKQLSLTLTMNATRTQWSTDINIWGIHASLICNCINSCVICRDVKIWNEIIKISQDILNVTLDTVCMKHIVLGRSYKCEEKKKQL